MAFRPKLAVSTLNSRHSFMAGDQTRIIGVLDLLDGAVVHAVAGQRATYLPIASRICDSSQADQVAQALAASFDIREFYIADLNAIAGGEGNWRSIQAVAAQSDRLWLDLGIGQATKVLALRHRLSQLQRHNAAMTLIIGLESVASQHELPRLLACGPTSRPVTTRLHFHWRSAWICVRANPLRPYRNGSVRRSSRLLKKSVSWASANLWSWIWRPSVTAVAAPPWASVENCET